MCQNVLYMEREDVYFTSVLKSLHAYLGSRFCQYTQ